MGLIIGLLSFVLVLTCLLLGLLILIQLPKKEAGGIGQAFGGGATDALFGTGSGNVLTKATKYSAGTFVILCVVVSWLTALQSRSRVQGVKDVLKNAAAVPAAVTPAPTPIPAPAAATPATLTNVIKIVTNVAVPTPSPASTTPAVAPTPTPAPVPSPAPAAPPKNN